MSRSCTPRRGACLTPGALLRVRAFVAWRCNSFPVLYRGAPRLFSNDSLAHCCTPALSWCLACARVCSWRAPPVRVLSHTRALPAWRIGTHARAYSRRFCGGARSPRACALSCAGALSAPAYSPAQDCKGAHGVFPYGSRRVYSRWWGASHSPPAPACFRGGARSPVALIPGVLTHARARSPGSRGFRLQWLPLPARALPVTGAPTMYPGDQGRITCTTSRLSLTLETDSSVLVL